MSRNFGVNGHKFKPMAKDDMLELIDQYLDDIVQLKIESDHLNQWRMLRRTIAGIGSDSDK
jgi:hypothetical protein